MQTPRVVVCIPSMATWMADTALALCALTQQAAISGLPIYITNIQCSVITQARNELVYRALQVDPEPTHILWIDSDVVFPPTALERLLAHDKDVVGAFYTKRVPPYHTAGNLVGNPDPSQGGLHLASLMPHGLVLVKTKVYKDLEAPWYYETFDKFSVTPDNPFGAILEDTNFSRRCIKSHIDMYCDLDLTFETGHIGEITHTCDRPEPRCSA